MSEFISCIDLKKILSRNGYQLGRLKIMKTLLDFQNYIVKVMTSNGINHIGGNDFLDFARNKTT